MNKRGKVIRCMLLALIVTSVTVLGLGKSSALAKNQELDISPSNLNQKRGDIFTIAVNYNVSDNDNTLSGIGINIHFDSSKLDYINYHNFLDKGDLTTPPTLINDTNDEDNDSTTDKMINMSWSSFQFPSDWPNEELPKILSELNFTVKQNAQLEATFINISVFEHDSGYGLDLSHGVVNIIQPEINVQGNSMYLV